VTAIGQTTKNVAVSGFEYTKDKTLKAAEKIEEGRQKIFTKSDEPQITELDPQTG